MFIALINFLDFRLLNASVPPLVLVVVVVLIVVVHFAVSLANLEKKRRFKWLRFH